jgi:hypothetical protein
VRVWDLGTGQQQAKLSGHDGEVRAVAIAADGRRAVSGGDDETVRAWDLEEGVEFALFASDSAIAELAITPAGTRVIAGASTGPVHLLELCGYEYANGQPPAQEPRSKLGNQAAVRRPIWPTRPARPRVCRDSGAGCGRLTPGQARRSRKLQPRSGHRDAEPSRATPRVPGRRCGQCKLQLDRTLCQRSCDISVRKRRHGAAGAVAGAADVFACNAAFKPTASVVGRDYAAPGIGADPLYDAWLVMCPGVLWLVPRCPAWWGLLRDLEVPRPCLRGCPLA